MSCAGVLTGLGGTLGGGGGVGGVRWHSGRPGGLAPLSRLLVWNACVAGPPEQAHQATPQYPPASPSEGRGFLWLQWVRMKTGPLESRGPK